MAIEIPKRGDYSGNIGEVVLGDGERAVRIGGETSLPFYLFEGEMPQKPVVFFEVTDIAPDVWPEALNNIFGDNYADAGVWAKKCVDEHGAEGIQISLIGTDPNGENLGADHAIEAVKRVLDAVDVPVTVWGSTNVTKDADVLKAVAEAFPDRRLAIGPVQEENHKQIGAACIAYGHVAINSSPIDINLAKQLNILTGNLGVQDQNIVMDPTVGGLGYGLEYTYSVMERARMAALTQDDDKLRYPLYCNLGSEVWKVKEARLEGDANSPLGIPEDRGIQMESMTAGLLLITGANTVVVRHPESARLARQLIGDLQG